MASFFVGVISLAILVGFLVGASSSPVAGVTITAVFGAFAGVLALYQKDKVLVEALSTPVSRTEEKGATPRVQGGTAQFTWLGRVLLAFAAGFALGLAVGIYARSAEADDNSGLPARVPWEGTKSPTSARAAIDWIIVQQKLSKLGYSDAQIAALYKLDLEAKGDGTQFLRDSPLLSPLLSETGYRQQSKIPVLVMDPKKRPFDWLGS